MGTARTGRTHGSSDQRCKVKILLANPEPMVWTPPHQCAMRALMDAAGLSEIATGVEPAHRTRKTAALTGALGHDLSILVGVGRQLGWPQRANTSMTIMRAPQHGHGYGSTRVVCGAISGCCWRSAAGGTPRGATSERSSLRHPPRLGRLAKGAGSPWPSLRVLPTMHCHLPHAMGDGPQQPRRESLRR